MGPRAGRVRGLRDIRTFSSLSRVSPVHIGLPSVDMRVGLGSGALQPRPRPNLEGPEQPRAWVFVKRPRFSRHQGMLLVDRVHEPEVDIFEEGRSLAVLVELPSVREEDIEVQVNGDVLILSTKPGHDEQRRRYYRELLLPFAVETGSIQQVFRNGVLELELERASSSSEAGRKKP